MTFDHKELSEKLVELYPSTREAIRYNNTLNPEYITRDIGELMKLAIKNELMIECWSDIVKVSVYLKKSDNMRKSFSEYFVTHDNDKLAATCAAIAKALIKLRSE